VCDINHSDLLESREIHAIKWHCNNGYVQQKKQISKHFALIGLYFLDLNWDKTTSDKPSLSFEDKKKKIAEIKFAALIVEKNILFKMAESILSFFQDLGKDSEILQSMTMSRKKVPKIINKVLYVREQERLVEILQNNKFSIFIDPI